jgi:hypothetical protein
MCRMIRSAHVTALETKLTLRGLGRLSLGERQLTIAGRDWSGYQKIVRAQYHGNVSVMGSIVGAGRGSRTPKTRRSADFESAASASSAIPALRGSH